MAEQPDPSPRPDSSTDDAFERLRKRRADESAVVKMYRQSGIAFEFIAAVAALTGIGWWIDSRTGSSPVWLLVGLGVGFAVGIYRLVIAAKKSME